MKRFASLMTAALAVAGGLALIPAGEVAAASAAPSLPTLNLALNGTKGITVSGSMVSGAVNVVSTFTGKSVQPQAGLIRLNPNEPAQTAATKGFQAVQAAHGDLNALGLAGDALIFDAAAPGSAQTVLAPGSYVALNLSGNGQPGAALFTVSQSSSPAPLPTPGATVRAIDFGFAGATTLHRGELVRFENDGFVVHMISAVGVKSKALAVLETDALKANKQKLAQKLATGFGDFAGPLSPGGMQQEVVNVKPGVYVLACFMSSEDGREHTQIGMERTIRVVR